MKVFLFWLFFSSSCLAMDLVVPAYFYPEKKGLTYWKQLATTAAQVPMTVILNPNDGPDNAIDPTFVTVSNNVRKAGATVIGYLYTLYGARPFSQFTADVDKYLSFYTVDGFFIDEMSDEANSTIIQYYKNCYNYIKTKNSRFIVTNNPGTTIPKAFLTQKVADRFVIFESAQKAYGSYSQPAWQTNYPASTFVHMIYNATAAQMPTDITYAKGKNIGGIFITNDKGENPYDTLPPYWNDEVAAVVAANG